ncbi:MAG: phenylacetate-CoA oxygenase subunit PaaJ [Clostridia bacterium]|nr:phenylacetate-CoA oxygenase subunit PaaJ [Clostridia bacterium]
MPEPAGEGLVERVREALATVHDPEIPSVSIVDLGLVETVRADEAGRVEVELLPTFTGCPALDIIALEAERAVRATPGVRSAEVRFVLHPAWTTDRISPEGRRRLREFGIAPPAPSAARPAPDVACPFCGSKDTVVESAFGPTRCRSIYYCRACRNPFEKIKEV